MTLGASRCASLPALCPECSVEGTRTFTGSYRPALWVGCSFRCASCGYAIESDDSELSELARSAFYAAHGKWRLFVRDLGPRRVDAIQTLRRIRGESLPEVMHFVRTQTWAVEGALFEVEHAQALLDAASVSTERVRLEDDADLVLASRRTARLDEQIRPFEAMWTHELGRYELQQVSSRDPWSLVIFDRETNGAVVVEIDEDAYHLLLHRMQAAGVPVRRGGGVR
ncbi:MAG: hypothetical protein JST00_03420 [Deltaproteobacteria bacterium]|nr:hypothetical protein [Deltaproteobacteria bacterium]